MTVRTSRFLEDPMYTRKYDSRIAAVLGDRAATFIQQVHYHAFWKQNTYGVGEWRSSLSEWGNTFPYWSEMTIRRIIEDCKKAGVLKIRKQTVPTGIAVWFSLDYDKLEELGKEGESKIEQEKARECSKRTEADVQIEQNPPCKLNRPPVQFEQHLVYPSSTTEESSISIDVQSSQAPPALNTASAMGSEKQWQIRQKHRTTLRSRFDKKQSSQALETWWKVMTVEYFSRTSFTPLNTVDKKNMRTKFVGWCDEASVHPLEFIEWSISNWERVRTKLSWAKDFPETPTFRVFYSLKDKFLEIFRQNGGEAHAIKKTKTVYTDVSQLPKDHPRYKQLKIVLDRMGKVEV